MPTKLRNILLLGATLVLTAAFLGCQSDITEATPGSNPNLDEDETPYCVFGYVYDGEEPMEGAYVDVYCASDCQVLAMSPDPTGSNGKYNVEVGKTTWENHEYCWCVSETPDISSAFYKLSEAGPPAYRLGPINIYYP